MAMAATSSEKSAASRAQEPEFQSLQEIVWAARRKLPQELWDHLSGGSDSETTLKRNRLAFDALALRQRVLVNVADIDTRATLLGQTLASPVFLAPVGGFLGMAHPEGAIPVVRAAVAKRTAVFVSTAAKPSIEAAAEAVSEPLIFQLYVRSGRQWIEEILDRAKAAGYRALCVTVDRAVYGRRERDLISRANVREGFGDPRYQASITWEDMIWMKERMGGPLIIKGIACAEDARLALQYGADVVYVSNHGGRQLDHGEASIEVLPEVVDAVEGRAEVVVDGGVLRGTDVVKAIALGARAVGVGKLLGWALAAGGQAAIERMLELLEIEIRATMALMGVTKLAELDRSWVRPAVPVVPGGTTTAYPWYEERVRGEPSPRE
jgi:isopentenyl diphosphate isomerase/L-lactate dehydrogenase-like FMN-dependent dehydrogenase